MKIYSDSFAHQAFIDPQFAFGKIGKDQPCDLSNNRNPHIAWSDVPQACKSLVLICVDSDVPSRGDDVNQAGRQVPADLPRVEFIHWLMTDIPANCSEIAAGSCSDGVSAHGKTKPSGPVSSQQGLNDYTAWFANDPEMQGNYLGYDGPCPPWNDALLHRYHFRLFALDIASLGLQGAFNSAQVYQAMRGHILAETSIYAHYTLNPLLSNKA